MIHVHEHGVSDAPALVLVHGLTDDGTCWPDAVERWKDRWHILAVDQRGHGHSPKFTEEQLPDSSGVLVDDLIDVLTQLAEPAIVVGHSLGGLVAARAARRAPELVRALVLEDPAKPREHWTGPENTEFTRQQLAFVEAVSIADARSTPELRARATHRGSRAARAGGSSARGGARL